MLSRRSRQMNKAERTVVLSDLGPDDTKRVLSGETGGTRLADIEDAVPRFIKRDYAAFRVEYDYRTGDFVIHFFLPKGKKVTERYWKVLFAEALDSVGQEHFQATKPRLVARYTEELHSWWFKAQH